MRRILKGIAVLITGLVGLTLVAIIAAVFFINPDDYRAKIAKSASKAIGHEVLLEGPISMHYFPWLGLQAKNVQVQASNQVSKAPLADIEELSFKVETMPLLKKEVNIHSIILNNARINLVVDKNGATSWERKVSKEESQPSENTNNKASESKVSKLEIAEILIKNSTIQYSNNQTKQNIRLNNFNFKTNDFKRGSSIPFQSDFHVLIDQGKKLDDQVKITAVLKQDDMKWTLEDVNLQNTIKHSSRPNKTIKADLKSTIVGDLLDKTVSFKSLSFDVDQVHGSGNATLSFAKRLHLSFDVKIDDFQADRYLAQSAPTKQEQAQATTLDSPFKHIKNEPSSSSFSYKGNLAINRLTAKGVSFSHVKMTAQNQGNGILLKPFSAGLFQGSFQGESTIQPGTKTTTVQGNLKGIDIPTLLKTFKTEPKLTGTGDAQVNVSVNAKGLSGTTRFQLKNGWIEGVDLEYYLKLARSILKKEQVSGNNSKRTKYNAITGTVVSNNNYLTNNDLRLEADDLYALGDGSIDLNQKYIEYKFTAHRKYNDNLAHDSALPLLVRVKGPFNAVKVTPDTDAYLKAFVKKEGKKQIEKQVTKQLGKILGGEPKGGDAAGSVEEGDGNPLQDAIDKGLNKIFKF